MPYAKVGAMPQPSDEEQQHGRGRGSRQGITMQDLKKQTALRLAQEQKGSQQQQRNFGGKQQQQSNPRQPQTRPVHMIPQPQLQYQGNTVYCGLNQSNLKQSYYHQQYGNQNQDNNRAPKLEKSKPQIHTCSYESHDEKERFPEQPLYEQNSVQPRQVQSNWQLEMLSETSSVRSYEYDCNASSVSNAEVGSTVSGGSSQHQNFQQPRHGPFFESLSVVRDVPVSPLPQNFSSPSEKRRQSRSHESPGAKSTPGGKPNVDAPGGSRSSRSNRSTGTKLRKQQQRSPAASQPSKPEQILKPQQNQSQMRVTSPNQYRMQEQSQEEDLSSFSGYSQSQDVRDTRSNKKNIARNIYQRCPVATTPKNKLPHGLTVSELKEMTRARLAAEAASEKHKQQTLLVVNQQQPLNRDNTAYPAICHSPREFNLVSESSSSDAPLLQFRSQSCDDNLCHKFQPNRASPELSATPQSQHCRHSPLSWQGPQHHSNRHHQLTPSQVLHPSSQNVSYLSPMKHSHSLHSYQQYRHCNQPSQQEQHRQQLLDSLETTSVASFNSTLGSESIHSTPFLGAGLQPPSNDEGSFFGRSWSYPAGASLGSALENETPKSTSSFFENSSGLGNMGVGRRSRLGSSPPGFHLEVAHEDRPLNVTVDLTLPLFETPRSNKWRLSHGENGCTPSSVESSTPQSARHQNMPSATGYFEPNANCNIDFSPSPAKHDRAVGSELILPPLSSDGKRVARSSEGSFSGDIPNLVAESVLFPSHQNDARSPVCASDDLLPTESNASIISQGGTDSVSEGALYNWLNTASGVFRNSNLNSTSSNKAVSDREEMVGNNESKAGNNSSSWARDLIGLTNHFGSILSFSKGCSENIDLSEGIVENDLHSGNFVSRIDPEVIRTSQDTPTSFLSEPRSVQDLSSNISRQAQAPLPMSKLVSNKAFCREGREEVSSPAVSASSKPRHRNSSSSGRKKQRDNTRRRRDHGSRS